jgi:hypothetical protein
MGSFAKLPGMAHGAEEKRRPFPEIQTLLALRYGVLFAYINNPVPNNTE